MNLKAIMAEAMPDMGNVPKSDEVAQVFDIVFKQLHALKKESDLGMSATQREINTHLAEMRKILAKIKKEGATVSSMKKILDSVVSWKEREMIRNPEIKTDVADTMVMCAENTRAIDKLMSVVKKMSDEMPSINTTGKIPDHEWNGTLIRFEQPDGSWGEYVNLQGPPGAGGESPFGSGMGGVRRIRAGSGITISGDSGEPTISASGGSGSGDVIGPASAVDSNFAAFDTTTGKLIKDSAKKASDFAPALGADDNYVTDAEKVVIGNTSGTNTGDNATNSQYSGLSAQIDAKLPLSGGTMTGSITLGENTGIALDPAGSADGKWSGITIAGVGGATIAFGRLVYLKAADSRWWEADADASATAGPVLMGMTVTSTTAGAAVTILLIGQIRADASFPALTIGAPVYAGETAGDIQVAIPTGADNVIRVVGFALTADEIYFNPSQDHQVTVA